MLENFINAIKSKNKQSIRSKNWKNWIAQIGDIKLCEDCRKMHGKIFPISELVLRCTYFVGVSLHRYMQLLPVTQLWKVPQVLTIG